MLNSQIQSVQIERMKWTQPGILVKKNGVAGQQNTVNIEANELHGAKKNPDESGLIEIKLT